MNQLNILDKATILHNMVSIGPMLPPTAKQAYLVARLPGDPDPELESSAEFAYAMHADVGAISVTFSTRAFKTTFVFDIWAHSTFDWFVDVLERNTCVVYLQGASATSHIECTDLRPEWQKAVVHLFALRASLPPREPEKFLETAFTLDLCADYAVHPNDATRMAASPAPLSATHFVLGHEHTDGWVRPGH